MIRALVMVNKDGHVSRKSIIGMPAAVLMHTGIREFCEETLLMYTMKQLPPGERPENLIEISRKCLVAENDDKLATMAANLDTKDDVGDITVLAGRSTLNAMDCLGMSYELDIISPNDTEVPTSLIEGRIQVDEDIVDDAYTMRRYTQSVMNASDTQIADAIAGLETFFNEQDHMDERDRSAVNKIASKIAMLNAAEERDRRRRSKLDSYDDGHDSDIGEEPDLDEELDCLWDAYEEIAKQVGETISMLNDVQSKFIKFMSDMNTKAELDQKLADKVNMVNGRVDMANNAINELRTQLGNAIAESIQKPKSKPHVVLYILLGISLGLNLINLLL